jgi:hypothetical protein
MPYSSDIAMLLAEQLAKFATLNRHQLAGQVANIDFWLGEVRHCLVRLCHLGRNAFWDRHELMQQLPGCLET